MSNYNELKITYEDGRQDTITLTSNRIGMGEYQMHNIAAVEVPEIVEEIEPYAFCDNNNLSAITLNEGLDTIGGQVFQHGVYSSVTIPSTVTSIGVNAFNIYEEQEHGAAGNLTITCLATTPPSLEDYEGKTFGNSSLITAIYVPAESVEDYKMDWSNYSNLIEGIEPTPSEPGFTNEDIIAAYVGNEVVDKIYLGNTQIYPTTPGPTPEYATALTLNLPASIYKKGNVAPTYSPSGADVDLYYEWQPDNPNECAAEIDSAGTLTVISAGTGYVYVRDENTGLDDSGYLELTLQDPMYRIPLTVQITDAGDAGDGNAQLGFRLNGITGTTTKSNPSAISVDYRIVGSSSVPTPLNLWGAPSSSAITKTISGLSSGDTIQFYAYGNNNKHYFALDDNVYTSFVHTGGLKANVYGNINSLLVNKDTFDRYAGGDDTVEFIASAYTYNKLFSGRTDFDFGTPEDNHIVLPEPTNGIVNNIYRYLFRDCTSLTAAPELPATALTLSCYDNMFNGCTSLTSAPELPAETLANNCYSNMFYGCTSLTQAPSLPATTLTDRCYQYMFSGCRSLTQAPELPATAMTQYCYEKMFAGCTGLTSAPALPATTLASNCYNGMFRGCTNLTQAPALPATTLTQSCYRDMFNGCTNLNYIKCLGGGNASIIRSFCSSWVSGVQTNSGTFVKNPNMSGWSRGTSGIPNNWTVEDAS